MGGVLRYLTKGGAEAPPPRTPVPKSPHFSSDKSLFMRAEPGGKWAESCRSGAQGRPETGQEQMDHAETLLRRLVDNLPGLAWSAQADGYIDFYNQRWYEYTGTTPDHMLGWGWKSVHDPAFLDSVMDRWRHSIQTGERFEMEFPLRRADGTFRWFLTRVEPLQDAKGRVVRWFGTNTDIHRQREESRKAMEANVAKDEFLAMASHELRTPLSAILGWSRLLREGNVDAAMLARGLETIERNAKVQVKLIEDILDGSRIITGNLRLEVRTVDLVSIVHAAVDAMRPAADAKSISLICRLDEDSSPIVGDPERLQQVVWNLLNNAVKFTPERGNVTICFERAAPFVRLVVSDSGQGIDAGFLPFVFDRFRQADSSSTRRHGGLGLGLSLVRCLVEGHGGTVTAESEGLGCGARFTVLLPEGRPHTIETNREPREKRTGPDERGILGGVDILVVDDEADGRELVATVLMMRGAVVRTARDAREAFELYRARPPKVIVSDVGMPEMDGYELISRIRKASRLDTELNAIALTAYVRDQDRIRAFEAGFRIHLSKPVDPTELIEAVAALAGRAPPHS